jgi:hypothetical protein
MLSSYKLESAELANIVLRTIPVKMYLRDIIVA